MKEGQGNEDGGGKEEDDEEEEGRDEEDDGRVLGVFVHHADYLPIGDQNILHPNVKVISTMLGVRGGFSSTLSASGSTRESCRWRSCPEEQLLHERFVCAGERLQRYPHPPAHDPAVQLQVLRFNIL